MGDKQVTTDDPFTNKMNVNLNVLSASMKNRILGEMDCTEVVALDNEGWWVKPELLEEGLEPKNLISYVSQTTVLCFNTRASYDLLFLWTTRILHWSQERHTRWMWSAGHLVSLSYFWWNGSASHCKSNIAASLRSLFLVSFFLVLAMEGGFSS